MISVDKIRSVRIALLTSVSSSWSDLLAAFSASSSSLEDSLWAIFSAPSNAR